jgi:ribosomal protein S18 acetylase RimI-like enzyme
VSEGPWRCRRLTDRGEIEGFLARDRVYAAYALADLEPPLAPQAAWYGALRGERVCALALLYAGLQPPVLFLMGEPTGLALLLSTTIREREVYVNSLPEHLPIVAAHYSYAEPAEMRRMAVTSLCFRPDPRAGLAERLTPGSQAEIQRLFSASGWSVIAFGPDQLSSGSYFGVREGGRLVAVAGTHVVDPVHRLAAVGNVFTHPERRERGYAGACTSRVTEELLRQGMDVVLNVKAGNAPALHVYHRLGYDERLTFYEMPARRRSLP